MTLPSSISRRSFLQSASLVAAGFLTRGSLPAAAAAVSAGNVKLAEFSYGDVSLASDWHEQQLFNAHSVLMGLNEDSLLKPFRQMGGMPAPGADLGGWYNYEPDYDYRRDSAGLAPGATFGQWVSALSRMYAIDGDEATREKVRRLNQLYAKAITGDFFEKNRFPAYCYDKLVCGLIDAQRFANDPKAFEILQLTTDTALPHLPKTAIDREQSWRPGKDVSYTWDESYTLPENLFLAYQRGAGPQYRELAIRFLDDKTYFDPLAAGQNVLGGKHAYSYVNALSSAMQAYLTLGSDKHLRAAQNGFAMLTEQSFATGGWGPDELLRASGSGEVAASLETNHKSFETPCGSYAHFKLTRYLLRVTGDARYGDSMERVMYNTVLGAKPLQPDGRAFYYSDYNFHGSKGYSPHRWPCCSGTLPQVAADYRINTYFRDAGGIYINLYIPSTVRWEARSARGSGGEVELTQRGEYPFDSRVQFELRLLQPSSFAINLRIPAWAKGASINVNGKRIPDVAWPGRFARVERIWKSGDRLELDLPLARQLEPIDAKHPDTVALMNGPLVLFAMGEQTGPVTRAQLLAAQKTAAQQWQIQTAQGAVQLLPFSAIDEGPYTTYLRVS